MTRVTRIDGNLAWFQFKTASYGEATRIEWDARVRVVVIERATAEAVLRFRHARNPTDTEADDYNRLVDEVNGRHRAPAPVPAAAPEPVPAPQPETAADDPVTDETEAEPEKRRRGRPPKQKD